MLLSFLSAFAFFLFKVFTWTILFSIPLGIAYYFYLKHRSTYFQRLGLPHPSITSTFLGNFEEFEKGHKQWETLKNWEKKYGQTFGMLLGAHRVIVTSDLDILNEVYVKRFHTFQARMIHPSVAVDQENGPQMNVFLGQGNRWKRLRALFSASLTISKIKSVDPIMKRAHEELIEVLKRNENVIIDVKPLILDMTFAVISRSAMGINEEFGKSEFLQKIMNAFDRGETVHNFVASFFAGTYDFLFITKYLQILHFFTNIRFAREMRSKIGKVITTRENETTEEKSKRHQDFLDFLREAQEDDLDTTNKPDFDTKIPKKLTRDELIGSAHAFLVAGGDTTATLITYCLYELALHPKIEQRVLEEIHDNIKFIDDIDYNNVKKLEYLERFVKEATRLHPSAYLQVICVTTNNSVHFFSVTARRAIKPTTLKLSDGSSIHIDRGTCVLPNIPSITQNKKIWGKDATEFNPDRFLSENSENCHPMAYLSFGAGLRICPGKNLAIYETKATLVRLLKEFKFEICDETQTEEITKATLGFVELKMKVIALKIL
uniref:Cytochrome P450 n=1 Tax=Panagrolaimus sp. PS1159 TaxID=55785 RepID=A0AC35GSR9_9BILA